ncbi:MAG: aminoglycoside phosphotransferase family protein [Bacilli bacterium]|nr:aminoglycoside phosphotransferase family protein [Bacilli bacterium]
MDEIINKIIEHNKELFGDDPNVEKINVGFTNAIYKVNESFIVKICNDIDNEDKFKKEIDFYKANATNTLIPKLFYSNTEKLDVPYFYEILEKIEGVTLYNVWHTFSEKQREDIIRQLCNAMKQMHSNIGESYDWIKYNKDKFNSLFEEAQNKSLLNEEEVEIIDSAYSLFDKYLESDEFVLIHNDLHFDNILVNDGKIKVIDFERSMYAPKDCELHILYYMIRQPWKHANEECEKYTKVEDYKNIMGYIEKYYPEIINIPNLYKRLAIYDLIYEFSHFVKFSNYYDELKEAVMSAAKRII